MYPGYSPADHIYGEAAAEYGAAMAEAKRQGKQTATDPTGIEYVVGDGQPSAKQQLENFKQQMNASKEQAAEGGAEDASVAHAEESAATEQLFMFDSNPTPIAELQNTSIETVQKGRNKANDKAKRRISSQEGQSDDVQADDLVETSRKKKKAKVAQATNAEEVISKPLVDENDISAEVDARMNAKEEKRERREEKKRKRDSEVSHFGGDDQVEVAPADELKSGKPKKKKLKDNKAATETEAVSVPDAAGKEKDGKKDKPKKKKRNSVDEDVDTSNVASAVGEGEKQKKKKRKTVASV